MIGILFAGHWVILGPVSGERRRRRAMMKARATTSKKATKVQTARGRYDELKQILVRAEGGIGEGQGVLDAAESSEADIQDDIEFALIQMKSETLNRIEEALARLDEGTFGNCFECGDEISERRLRALPFAVRCKDCEEARELAERRERVQSQRRPSGLLLDMN
jgi:DnaK suppressor protein